jgi:hypothetical protein
MSNAGRTSKVATIIGWVIGVFPSQLMIMSATMKLTKSETAIKGFQDMGYDPKIAIPLGVVELACAALYLFPRTAVLGAIFATGYLGGATATHVRMAVRHTRRRRHRDLARPVAARHPRAGVGAASFVINAW